MALLRIRVELHRPDTGIEMPKLAELSGEMQKLFRMVADDIGIEHPSGNWVAKNFYNQGIGFDAEYQTGDIDQQQVEAYLHTLDQIATVGDETGWNVRGVRPETLVQAAKVAKVADEGELVRLGFLNGATPGVSWRPLHKGQAATILERFDEWVEYRGMFQGLIHSLYKEAQPPYFDLRDFATGNLVKCQFELSAYEDVVVALKRKDSVVLVSGWVRAKRVDRRINAVRVERIQSTEPFDEEKLKAFFGSAPGWTGDLTTDKFIDAMRGRDDGQ